MKDGIQKVPSSFSLQIFLYPGVSDTAVDIVPKGGFSVLTAQIDEKTPEKVATHFKIRGATVGESRYPVVCLRFSVFRRQGAFLHPIIWKTFVIGFCLFPLVRGI